MPDAKAQVLLIIGARPNLPKAATVVRAFATAPVRATGAKLRIIHTGQHADRRLGLGYAGVLGVVIDEVLDPPEAARDGARLGGLLSTVDVAMSQSRPPDLAIVVGDVNSTLAAALVASRLGTPVMHVEAGIRSGVHEPEEVNRKAITAASRYHLAPSRLASENLHRENVPEDQTFFVGNAHTETFLRGDERRANSRVLTSLGLKPAGYLLLSVHKTPTLDRVGWLERLVPALCWFPRVVWVVHPTAQAVLAQAAAGLLRLPRVQYVEPQPYDDFGRLLVDAGCVITDSAGMQEEATVVGVPCVTVGVHTARPETITHGSNTYAGFDAEAACAAVAAALDRTAEYPVPDRWDTRVSERIGRVLTAVLEESGQRRRPRHHYRERI